MYTVNIWIGGELEASVSEQFTSLRAAKKFAALCMKVHPDACYGVWDPTGSIVLA